MHFYILIKLVFEQWCMNWFYRTTTHAEMHVKIQNTLTTSLYGCYCGFLIMIPAESLNFYFLIK